MTKLFGVFVHRGLCDDVLMAFDNLTDAKEMVMDLYFEKYYEAFCYYMSVDDVHWYCDCEELRGIKSDLEIALYYCTAIQEEYYINIFPAFIALAPYC